ncbi:MAG: hypothetical protein OEL83_16705 [Desulforhopalus sp.]|nr:hypothetical protein [Desulforhopalus sp.]
MLFTVKATYFPALLLHFLPGTLVSQTILLGCAILPLFKWRDLQRYRIQALYVVTVLPMALLGYVAVQKFFALGYSLTEIGVDLALYLGLFGFFYGVLIAEQVNQVVIERVLWILLTCVLVHASGLVEAYIRYYFLALPILTVVAVASLIGSQKKIVSRPLIISPLLFAPLMVFGRLEVTFTLLLTVLVALLIILSNRFWRDFFLGISTGKVLCGVAISVMFYVMITAGERGASGYLASNLRDVESWSDIFSALEFKAFGDRGVLWTGTWETLVYANNVFPPIHPPLVEFKPLRGSMQEVTYGAHNIGLELLRQYGFAVGFVGISLYLLMVGHAGKIFMSRSSNYLSMTVGAVVMANAVVGGLVGQFVLMNNFSYLLMGLLGVVFGQSSSGERWPFRRGDKANGTKAVTFIMKR